MRFRIFKVKYKKKQKDGIIETLTRHLNGKKATKSYFLALRGPLMD